MKIAAVLPLLVIAVDSSCDENIKCRVVDAVISQLFELLRHLIEEGSLENNIPVLDPFQKEYQKVDLANDKLRLKAELSNIKFSGLRDFELIDSTFEKSDISFELNLRFPMLSIVADHYNMSGAAYGIFPLFGDGSLHIEACSLKIRTKVHLTQSVDGRSILITKMSRTQFEIDKILSRTEFDGNIDDILNAMMEDLLADYLSRFSKYIAAQHEEYATQVLNQYISPFESWRLIAAIL